MYSDFNRGDDVAMDENTQIIPDNSNVDDSTQIVNVDDVMDLSDIDETEQNNEGVSYSVNKGKRIALCILCAVLSLILICVLTVAIVFQNMLNRINRVDLNVPTLSDEQLESVLNQEETTDPTFTGPTVNVEDVTMPSQPVEELDTDNVINLLLVGQDRREGEGRRHSDSTILITINKSTKTLTMTSFMRDMWVYIPYKSSGFYERINCAYMVGGFNTLNATLQHNFGVSSNHNVEVDFKGFEAIIDKIGGVEIELTAAEANYLNTHGNWDVDTDKSWSLKPGSNLMTGSQALAYSRLRAIGNDQGRTNRQRTVLMALVNKAKTMDILELYNLVYDLLPMITTDMTDSEILSYVMDLAPMLSDLNIVSQRIPADGYYSSVTLNDKGVMKMVLMLNEEQLKKNIELLTGALKNG